jgi:hypothetical protein
MTLEKKGKEGIKEIAIKWLSTEEGLTVLRIEYESGYAAGITESQQAEGDAYDEGYEAGVGDFEVAMEDAYKEAYQVGYDAGRKDDGR